MSRSDFEKSRDSRQNWETPTKTHQNPPKSGDSRQNQETWQLSTFYFPSRSEEVGHLFVIFLLWKPLVVTMNAEDVQVSFFLISKEFLFVVSIQK